jgi:hypothetical protein
VTSRPSRIQTVPKAMMIRQCHAVHGSRSIRAGICVETVSGAVLALMAHDISAARDAQTARRPQRRRYAERPQTLKP